MAKYTPCWEASLISKDALIRDALQAITNSGSYLACVVEEDRSLVGVVTDSDIRRALLRGIGILDSVSKVVVRDPVVAQSSLSSRELLEIALESQVREIPLLSRDGKVSDIFVAIIRQNRSSEMKEFKSQSDAPLVDAPLFIMAGGLGTRLRSVSMGLPKPLVKVGDRPLLQTVILWAKKCGFREFFVSVNYEAEKIVSHLKDGVYDGLEIKYLYEDMPLGTAGSLSLLPSEFSKSVVVCNADVLTKIPIHRVVEAHHRGQHDVTCVVRPLELNIPYGVFKVEGENVREIDEKPLPTFLVNSGIYVLGPRVLSMVEKGVKVDMPTIIEAAVARSDKLSQSWEHHK